MNNITEFSIKFRQIGVRKERVLASYRIVSSKTPLVLGYVTIPQASVSLYFSANSATCFMSTAPCLSNWIFSIFIPAMTEINRTHLYGRRNIDSFTSWCEIRSMSRDWDQTNLENKFHSEWPMLFLSRSLLVFVVHLVVRGKLVSLEDQHIHLEHHYSVERISYRNRWFRREIDWDHSIIGRNLSIDWMERKGEFDWNAPMSKAEEKRRGKMEALQSLSFSTISSAAALSFIVHEPSGIIEWTSEISLFSRCFI